jgi:DNA-binding response OmpR family regulator
MAETEPKGTILIIDDNPDALETLSFLLREKGYRALTAHGGRSGIALAQAEKPDLILLDIMMPDMNGYQVCQTLKQDPSTEKIPIVILTVRKSKRDVSYASTVGAADYLTKPVRPTQLLSAVEAHLRPEAREHTQRRIGVAPVLAISTDNTLLRGLSAAIDAHNFVKKARNRYTLVHADDHSQACAVIAGQRPAAIIVDAGGRNRDPEKTVHRLKTDRRHKDIPVIVIRHGETDELKFAWANARVPGRPHFKNIVAHVTRLVDQ